MPICGYDPLMGVALGEFAEGLVRSMGARARRLTLTLPGQLAEEKDELFILFHVLQREIAVRSEGSVDRRNLEAFLAIVLLARYLMGLEEAVPRARQGFEDRLRRNAVKLDTILRDFETAFESLPRDKAALERVLHAVGTVLVDRDPVPNSAGTDVAVATFAA